MKKRLSTREIALFIILLFLLVFMYIGRGPLQTKKDTLEAERASIENQIYDLQPQIQQIMVWQKAIDKSFAAASGNPKSIPDFNNINNIMAEMSSIFDGDSTYSITFADPIINERIVTRNIRINFTVGSYGDMIDKLVAINNSDNRYRITDLSIGQAGSESYSAAFGLISYEYYPEG